MDFKLDHIDRKILDILQRDGAISNVQLAAKVNLSPAPCLRRVAALEAAGVIRHYAAVLDAEKVGFHLQVFVVVKLVKGGKSPSDEFHRAVAEWPEVTACYALTGDIDYLLRVQVPDLAGFNLFLNEKLLRQSGVIDTRSSIVIESIKETSALPLEDRPARKRSTGRRRRS